MTTITLGKGTTEISAIRTADGTHAILLRPHCEPHGIGDKGMGPLTPVEFQPGDIVIEITASASAALLLEALSATLFDVAKDESAKYHELIHAVAQKHDGETRHETALRKPLIEQADKLLDQRIELTKGK